MLNLESINITKEPINRFSINDFIISNIDSALLDCIINLLDSINTIWS